MCPLVGRSTGLHRRYTGRQGREKVQHLTTWQFLAECQLAVDSSTMSLKNLLYPIQPDVCSLFQECVLFPVM